MIRDSKEDMDPIELSLPVEINEDNEYQTSGSQSS